MTCDRCGKQTNMVTGSFFNASVVCLECDKLEQADHPEFLNARRVETEYVERGYYDIAVSRRR